MKINSTLYTKCNVLLGLYEKESVKLMVLLVLCRSYNVCMLKDQIGDGKQ